MKQLAFAEAAVANFGSANMPDHCTKILLSVYKSLYSA